MIRYFILLLFAGSSCFLNAQHNRASSFPAEQGRILYEYSGNTEGLRELYFRNHGKEMALYTNLSRSSTFFAITTTTAENVIEFLKDGKHYHFDLETKKGLVHNAPIRLLKKYFRISDSKPYHIGLENIGAFREKYEMLNGYECEKWIYRDREFWLWRGMLIKMVSKGLNKNFTMEVVEIDLETPVAEDKFVFPETIEITE